MEFRLFHLVSVVLLAFAIAGCEGDDGAPGADGVAGTDGIACWDLNGNGTGDPDEDVNGDGVIDVVDCNALASGAYTPEAMHAGYFTDNDYEGTKSCLNCHGLVGMDMLTRAHFTWEGVSSNVVGVEGEIHGKNDFINNFCIAVPTNEGRCSECHAGYGYADKSFFDAASMNDVDCLVCHDQSGTYVKGKKTAGLPDPDVDLNVVARSVGQNGGVPTRANCIGCHANAGGADNVKHGDLSMAMLETTKDFDVHMGVNPDGTGDMHCVECHGVKKDSSDAVIDHGIGGMPYHSVDEGVLKTCEDCHGDAASIHVGLTVENIIAQPFHQPLACQVCHIPTFARQTPTKTKWLWSEAGQDIDPIPVDPVTGKETYAKKKGRFEWANNVRPTLRYFDGKWSRFIIDPDANVTDKYMTTPVVLGEPVADYNTPGAKIYPFKKMIGNQPADAVNQTMLVPHLFGLKGGDNPYWVKFDWNLALQDGAAYTGQTFSGSHEFVDTVMYLTVNHEVAPKEQAYGMDGACGDCHGGDQIDWTELGWTADPLLPGTPDRP
jgi:octaheme c-type cytochrome (tetrathionate reductase family)